MIELFFLVSLIDLPEHASWNYAMQGNIDAASLRCRGTANISRETEAGRLRCVSWSILKQQCTGNESVDWLHQLHKEGKMCESPNGWVLKSDLPGRAFCIPNVVSKNGALTSFSLSCTWECQSKKYACAGQGSYKFSPAPRGRQALPAT